MQNYIHVDDQSKEVVLNQIVAQINLRGKYTAISTNTPATLSGAQATGADLVTVDMTAVLAGAGTLNTPTAAQILAANTNLQVGETFRLRVINNSSGAFAWTLTAGNGVTINGTATIAQNTFRDFLVTITSATAVTIQNIGSGTN